MQFKQKGETKLTCLIYFDFIFSLIRNVEGMYHCPMESHNLLQLLGLLRDLHKNTYKRDLREEQ